MSGLDPWEVYYEDLDLPGAAKAFLVAAQAHLPLDEPERTAAAQESAVLGSLAVTESGMDEQALRRAWASAHDSESWRDDPTWSLVGLAEALRFVLVDGTWTPDAMVDALAHCTVSPHAFEVTRWAARMAREYPFHAEVFMALRDLAGATFAAIEMSMMVGVA